MTLLFPHFPPHPRSDRVWAPHLQSVTAVCPGLWPGPCPFFTPSLGEFTTTHKQMALMFESSALTSPLRLNLYFQLAP